QPDHPRPPRAQAVPLDLRVDVHVRRGVRPPLVRGRAVPRDRPRQARHALPADLPVDPRAPLRDPRLPLAARLGRPLQRRLRRDQPGVPHARAVALRRRRVLVAAVHHLAANRRRDRERVADEPVLLPRVSRRAAVDPRGADRGRPRRRRRAAADLPARDAAAPARGRRAADDRLVRVQLQQLQQRVPADGRRSVHGHLVDRGQHGHPDQLHVQAGDRLREGQRLRSRERGGDHHLLHRRRDLRRVVLAHQVAGDAEMSVEEAAATRVAVAAKAGRPSGRPRLKDTWWRHLVALVAVFVALFPVVYIVSSAFNSDNNLSTAGAYPAHPTLHNFGALLHNHVVANTGALQDVPYLHWFLNSMLIAGLTALFTTMLGALAAY